MLCRSAGKWQIKCAGWRHHCSEWKRHLFSVAVWRHAEVFLASAVTSAPAGIWGSHRVLGYQSGDMQVFFVTCLHGSSSCSEIKHHSSLVIVIFMDPFWAIICKCFHYSSSLWLPYCSCSHHNKKRREAKKRSGKNCLLLLSPLKFLLTCRMFVVSNYSPVVISKKCFAQMLNTVRSGLNLLLDIQVSKQSIEIPSYF